MLSIYLGHAEYFGEKPGAINLTHLIQFEV